MRKLSSTFFLNSDIISSSTVKEELASVIQRETFVAVNLEDLDDVIKNNRRKEKGPLAASTLIDLDQGLIVPVFHETDLSKIPQYIPYWPYVKDGKVKVFLNLSRYAKRVPNSTELNIPAKTFHGLCVSADIVRKISENPARYTGSTELVVNTGIIFSRMIRKIIDKAVAISVDPVLDDKVRYILGKYFAISVCGITSPSMIENIAGSCVEKTGMGIVTTVNEIFKADAYSSFDKLIGALSTEYPRLSKLSVRLVVQEVAKLYGITSIVGIDFLPYLVASIT